MNTETTPTFKPTSFDWVKFILTNGMAWNHSVRAIGKCTTEGNVELQDGTVVPMVQRRQYDSSLVYYGYLITVLPQSWLISEAEYKGNKVLKIEQDYTQPRQKVEFEHGQIVETETLRIQVEGYKTIRKVKYNNKEFARLLFFPTDLADTTSEYKFKPLERLEFGVYGNEGIYFNYSGGGYGEKYYVTSVSFDERFLYRMGNNLTEEFKRYFMYGKISEDWMASPEWLQMLGNTDNWEIEVESVPYEGGYTPSGYVFNKNKIAELNALIQKHIDSFTGKKRVDWRELLVAANHS